MKKGGGKQKGSSFERDIAKFLSKWILGKETCSSKDYVFWRSPSSGAMFTVTGINEVSGDLMAIKPEGMWFLKRFSIECKTGYPNVNFHQHLKNIKNFGIEEFWKQCLTDATKANKFPMVIFKKQGLNSIVGINCEVRLFLKEQVKLPKSITLSFDDLTSIVFYDMIEFFNIVTPSIIEGLPLWQN